MANTIQECIDEDYDLWVWCDARNCTHGQRLDLKALRNRLGPDHSVLHYDLDGKFRCSKCGSKKVSFRKSPGGGRPQGIEGAWSGRKG